MEEAVARGQLSLEDYGKKRRRTEENGTGDMDRRQGSGRGRSTGRGGRGKAWGRGTDTGWGGRGRGSRGVSSVPTRDVTMDAPKAPPDIAASSDPSSGSDGSDDEPEVVSSKSQPMLVIAPDEEPQLQGRNDTTPQPQYPGPRQKGRVHEPKRPLRNPFASRPTLLRNVSSIPCSYILPANHASSYYFLKSV